MTPKRTRLSVVLILLAGAGLATFLTAKALGNNLSYFRTPTQVVTGAYPEKNSGRSFRLGGLVEKGSVVRNGISLDFKITDLKNEIAVHYEGVVPDLFRAGQGVIVEGKVGKSGVFQASVLLAKHDAKYMPPEVKDELKKAGHV
ncbi:MAG: cytochrome c maturation protein CcmE [Alphaproteobacteria bacterium]|nr:cytochrome c maturation protein CcmE [Alphaproteobacteria bacterium]